LNTDRILDYQLSCIGGLEDVASDELQASLGGRIEGLRIERGEVGGLHFRTEASPKRLLELTCPTAIEAIVSQAHDVTVGQPGLERIGRCLRSASVATLQRLARACDPNTDVESVDLRISLRGAHRFTVADIEAQALPILADFGMKVGAARAEHHALHLSIRVRKKRVLITVHLGMRRPAGDPKREGWAGPAQSCVAHVLDLASDLPIAGMPVAGRRPGISINDATILGQASCLPLVNGALPVLLLVPDLQSAAAIEHLREAVRVVAAGGVLGLLVQRGEQLAVLLRELELPLEVMATIPYYVRRRRWALFLLERLDLLGIELA
jgi:hypothetical protein